MAGSWVLGARLMRVVEAEWDHPGEAVLRQAMRADADLIVLGARGQTVGTGLTRTSIADHVLSHAHCPVFLAAQPVIPTEVAQQDLTGAR